MNEKLKPVLLVHGGAARIAPDRIEGKLKGVQIAAHVGFLVLQNGGNALDAVEAAVRCMEDDEYFNAGFGSVLNMDGEAEMDASIMDGRFLNAGAVALAKEVKNPISFARFVMDRTPHVMIAAHGIQKFAQEHHIPLVPPKSLVSNYAKQILDEFIKKGCPSEEIGEDGGTVGAVSCDKDGHCAAATSTGGVNGKWVGRIGDTPLIGSGTYADDKVGAVSCTGHGESILKCCMAHSIIKRMEYEETNRSTIDIVQQMMDRLNKKAGAIAVSKNGEIGLHFTTVHMPWASEKDGTIHYGLEPGQHDITKPYEIERRVSPLFWSRGSLPGTSTIYLASSSMENTDDQNPDGRKPSKTKPKRSTTKTVLNKNDNNKSTIQKKGNKKRSSNKDDIEQKGNVEKNRGDDITNPQKIENVNDKNEYIGDKNVCNVENFNANADISIEKRNVKPKRILKKKVISNKTKLKNEISNENSKNTEIIDQIKNLDEHIVTTAENSDKNDNIKQMSFSEDGIAILGDHKVVKIDKSRKVHFDNSCQGGNDGNENIDNNITDNTNINNSKGENLKHSFKSVSVNTEIVKKTPNNKSCNTKSNTEASLCHCANINNERLNVGIHSLSRKENKIKMQEEIDKELKPYLVKS